ncbi:MAG: toprim domain-containing protein [Bacteroidetes bacterium]|nr:toprim domain-containing protein [Bacteroidota bacterium]
MDFARSPIIEADTAVVVEGYMDVLAAHQRGFRNVVASLGTAISEEQLRTLKRFTKNIVLALDPDVAGGEATIRGLDVARQSLDRVAVPVPTWRGYIRYEQRLDANLRIAVLPAGKDPDEVLRESTEEWARRVAEAMPVVDYYLQAVLARADLSSAKGMGEAVGRVAPLLAEISDPTVRAVYTQRLADRLKVDGRRLTERVAQERARASRRRPSAPPAAEPEQPPAAESTAQPARESRLSGRLEYEDGVSPVSVGDSSARGGPAFGGPRQAAAGLASAGEQSMPASSGRLWERYLVALALSYPEAAALLSELLFDEVDDVVCKEVLKRRMEWQGEWSADAFCEGLDAVLRPFVVELTVRAASEPKLTDSALQREVREAMAELRRCNLRRRIQELHYLKREAEEAGDAASVRELIAQTEVLLAQLGPYDTQGRAKALVWR